MKSSSLDSGRAVAHTHTHTHTHNHIIHHAGFCCFLGIHPLAVGHHIYGKTGKTNKLNTKSSLMSSKQSVSHCLGGLGQLSLNRSDWARPGLPMNDSFKELKWKI